MQQVVTPNNLGNTIKPNAITANKYDVNVDDLTVKVDGTGKLFVEVAGILASLVSADAGNDIILGTDGKLYADVPIKSIQIDGVAVTPDAFGNVNLTDNDVNSIIDSTSIDLQLVGTQLTAVVKVSSVVGNLITVEADGLAVKSGAVRSLLDVEVQDAFGVILFYASSTNV